MNYNYHTHTFRCHHASGTEREYIENAIQMGIKTLGFADHTPQLFPGDYYSDFRMRPEELEEYVSTLVALREEYKDQITIKIGLETEYYPQLFGKLRDFIRGAGIDYMILGQHFLDNEYDTHFYSADASRGEELLAHYTSQVLEGLQTGCFTYLAHPDLPRFDGDDAVYEKYMRPFCEEIRKLHLPLEVNFLGMMAHRHYPCEKFFRIAADVGNDIVLGIDAHSADSILRQDILEEALAFCAKFDLHPLNDVVLRSPV